MYNSTKIPYTKYRLSTLELGTQSIINYPPPSVVTFTVTNLDIKWAARMFAESFSIIVTEAIIEPSATLDCRGKGYATTGTPTVASAGASYATVGGNGWEQEIFLCFSLT